MNKNFECNINEIVSTKLVDCGREISQDQHDELKITIYKESDSPDSAIVIPFENNFIKFSGDPL
jgi:hypothetical protein